MEGRRKARIDAGHQKRKEQFERLTRLLRAADHAINRSNQETNES